MLDRVWVYFLCFYFLCFSAFFVALCYLQFVSPSLAHTHTEKNQSKDQRQVDKIQFECVANRGGSRGEGGEGGGGSASLYRIMHASISSSIMSII